MAGDPISALAAGINSSIKILEVTYLLKAVGEQTTDLLRTTEHVNRNVNEARRLRRLKASLISADEQSWMDATIGDTEKALLEVAQLIEPARVDVSTSKSINSKNRVLWVFRDSPKVRDKHNRLSICHQSLIGVINGLYAKDVVVVAPLPQQKDDQPPPYNAELEAMFNWRSQKRRRKSITNLNAQSTSPDPHSPRSDSFSPPVRCPDSELPEPCFPSTLSHAPNIGSTTPGTEEMSAIAMPSSFYSSFEGADGLQVQDFQGATETRQIYLPAAVPCTQPPPPPETWSQVTLSPNNSFVPYAPSSPMSYPQAPVASSVSAQEKFPEMSRPVHSPDSSTAGSSPLMAEARPGLGRASTRSRGRQWLACYAARSDMGWEKRGGQ